jgi:hypothetical protein
MQHLARLITTVLATTLLLTLTAAQASARIFRASNQQIRVTWRRLELIGSDGTNFARCPVTLEGSFHAATIAKIRGSLIGYITRPTVGTCETGRVTVLTATLPWHIVYQSFSGPLPNITRLRFSIIGSSVLVEQLGFRCLLRTTAESPASGEELFGANGRVEGLKPDETMQIPVGGGLGGFGCPCPTGGWRTEASDAGIVTLLGTNNSISVTLI